MTEQKKAPRKFEEIEREYTNLATRAGHLQYQIFALQRDLDVVNTSLLDLNFEANESKVAEAEEAQKKAKEEADKAAVSLPPLVDTNKPADAGITSKENE